MKTTFISTATLINSPRLNVARLQSELAKASTEVVTARHADIGMALGSQTSRSVTLRQDHSIRDALTTANGAIITRLQQSQSALSAIAEGGNTLVESIISSNASSGDPALQRDQARAAFDTLSNLANASDGRRYLFGGINSGERPMVAYDAGPKAAVDAAFLATFGFAQDDPAASGIGVGAMQAFLDTTFAALFDDPAWSTTWSNASSENVENRISPDETVTTSTSTHDTAMRKLAMAYTMIGELGLPGLTAEVRDVVLREAAGQIGAAVSGLTATQARLGIVEQRVEAASARLEREQLVINTRLNALEGVDQAESKVKIDMLSTQIEMSYSLTVKLSRLSIMNYA